MGAVGLEHYLVFATLLFVLGMAGFFLRRNLIVVLMCVELMLNGVNVMFIAFSRYLWDARGHVFTLFIIAVAAAEAVIGLAIILYLFRHKATVDIREWRTLRDT